MISRLGRKGRARWRDLPITSFYDTPLMVTRGFSSETFAYEAVAARKGHESQLAIAFIHGSGVGGKIIRRRRELEAAVANEQRVFINRGR
jgi:hypothetical protein